MKDRKYDLEDRLVDYTCRMIDVVEALPNTRAGNYIAGQLIKSSHSPTFNYGEAQAAESTKDFIHKMGVVLKELKECRTTLKVIIKKEIIKPIMLCVYLPIIEIFQFFCAPTQLLINPTFPHGSLPDQPSSTVHHHSRTTF